MKKKKTVILMADDDTDDTMLVREAFMSVGISTDFRSVENGQELLDYLRREGSFAGSSPAPWPDLILLDLNMPIVHGKEALKEIKDCRNLRKIPVVVLTTSAEETNISECYCLGANAYLVKPAKFEELAEAAESIARFWFHHVELPSATKDC
ncbi:MAG: response regulator [Acidobacteriota bacterium]